MIDFDSIWRTQDEIRTVVNAVLGALDLWSLATVGTQEVAGTTVLGSILCKQSVPLGRALGNMTVVVFGLCSRITFLIVAVASHILSVVAMAILLVHGAKIGTFCLFCKG